MTNEAPETAVEVVPQVQPPVTTFHFDARELKLCPNGHVVGARVREADGVLRLLLFRVAMPMMLPTGLTVVAANCLGMIDAAKWLKCSQCGTEFNWKPGGDFLSNVRKRHKGKHNGQQ